MTVSVSPVHSSVSRRTDPGPPQTETEGHDLPGPRPVRRGDGVCPGGGSQDDKGDGPSGKDTGDQWRHSGGLGGRTPT